MNQIRQFATFEEALDALDQDVRFALEHLHPMQATITFGSYCVLPTADGEVMFGYVKTREELSQWNAEHGVDTEEAEAEDETLVESDREGHAFGRWHSTYEPEGELGTRNKIMCWPIHQLEFEAMRDLGWDLGNEGLPMWLALSIGTAIQLARVHQRMTYGN